MGRRKYADIEVRGAVYPTARAAAQALGVDVKSVARACRSGRLDTLGLGRGRGHRMPVRIAGRDFAGLGEAAAHFGCTPSAISKAISDGDPDRVARKSRGGGTLSRPVVLGGVRFPSMAAASRALGFSSGYVAKVMGSGSARRRERLLAAAMRLRARMDADARRAA